MVQGPMPSTSDCGSVASHAVVHTDVDLRLIKRGMEFNPSNLGYSAFEKRVLGAFLLLLVSGTIAITRMFSRSPNRLLMLWMKLEDIARTSNKWQLLKPQKTDDPQQQSACCFGSHNSSARAPQPRSTLSNPFPSPVWRHPSPIRSCIPSSQVVSSCLPKLPPRRGIASVASSKTATARAACFRARIA